MRCLLPIALILALAACPAQRAADAEADAGPPTPGEPAPAGQAHAPAAPSAVPGLPPALLELATFAGYGDVKFGTAAKDMEAAWGGRLNRIGDDANARCYFMTPLWVTLPSEFHFMISEGRFARFGTDSPKFAAPGGGKVGMTEAALQALYDHALAASPHAYTRGKYLSINASGVAPTRLVFETDEQGLVTEWRVGLVPEVDYVEGCA